MADAENLSLVLTLQSAGGNDMAKGNMGSEYQL